VDWRGEYFGNADLTGMPQLVRNDKAVDFDWGANAPAVGLPVDGFSARWTRALYFADGLYRFRAIIDDGIRVYIDGVLVIDQWRDGGRREVTMERRMTAGQHTLRVEYYERSGAAVAQVRWEQVTVYADWRGEYWPNLSLQGNPAIVRNDANVDFDWREGSPSDGIPADNFSARWTRNVSLNSGTYRFHVLADDGVRLWLDGRLILDAWSDHDSVDLTTDYVLTGGTYALKVEYYERIGKARMHLWWEKVAVPSYPDWRGEYWPNRTFSGDVVLVRNDREVNFSWGSGSPSPGVPADSFAARWTRQWFFEATTYRFHALADDGIRLWVDGQLLIDKWQDRQPTEFTAHRTMVHGTHTIRVEYYEHTGGARVHVWWEKAPTTYPDWKGEYWTNRDLDGQPALLRNDESIDFDWGTGAPAAGLPADNLSARWTRRVTFQPGVYRFYARADDGVRASLDGRWIINEWHDARPEVYSTELPLNGTTHQVLVEYYERGGHAAARFWWQRIGDLPPPAPAPRAQFSSAVYTVDEGSGSAAITVLLSSTSDRTVTVDYATSGGTATSGSDYAPASGTLTFVPGTTSRTFTVSIVDDGVDETEEAVVLTLSNPVNAQLGAPYQATLTIVDDDEPPLPPEARFSAAAYSVDEGAGTATINVLLGAASERTVTVDYATSGGSASAGSDYAVANGTLTFAPGATSRTFSVSIVDDGVDETDETVVLALSSPVNAQLGASQQATLTIIDNDEPAPPPEVRFSAATYSVDEGAGTGTITVFLDGVSDRAVSVDYATSDGTAGAGSDYDVAKGTLTFDPGVTQRTFSVGIIEDSADETDETVALALSSPVNAQLGAPYQATLTIIDDDEPAPPPEVRFSAANYSVGEGAGTATIIALLSGASDRTVTVDYATSDGTARAGSDYAKVHGRLGFAPGETSQTFAVQIIDDGADEEDETLSLRLDEPTNAVLGAPSQAVLAIIDDDTTPPVSARVRLNEILPAPGGTDWDGNGTADELDEWIEVYNAGTVQADLSGWQLDNTEEGSAPYQIPSGTVLEPGAFLVLYHQTTDLILDDERGMVRLLDASGQVVDDVAFAHVGANTSYNRSESGSWYLSPSPSPGTVNAAPPVP
jgi:hypothetical protein